MPPLRDLHTHFFVVVALLWCLNNEETESLYSMFYSLKKKTHVIHLKYSWMVGACGLNVCAFICVCDSTFLFFYTSVIVFFKK